MLTFFPALLRPLRLKTSFNQQINESLTGFRTNPFFSHNSKILSNIHPQSFISTLRLNSTTLLSCRKAVPGVPIFVTKPLFPTCVDCCEMCYGSFLIFTTIYILVHESLLTYQSSKCKLVNTVLHQFVLHHSEKETIEWKCTKI